MRNCSRFVGALFLPATAAISLLVLGAGGSKALFTGDIIDGPKKIEYSVSAIPAGTYEFRCDPHSELMFGTFNVS